MKYEPSYEPIEEKKKLEEVVEACIDHCERGKKSPFTGKGKLLNTSGKPLDKELFEKNLGLALEAYRKGGREALMETLEKIIPKQPPENP